MLIVYKLYLVISWWIDFYIRDDRIFKHSDFIIFLCVSEFSDKHAIDKAPNLITSTEFSNYNNGTTVVIRNAFSETLI